MIALATEMGMDGEQFRKDMEDPALNRKVQSDRKAAETMGTRGTPAFIINGRKQVGWGSAAGIASMVKKELVEVEKLVAAGKPAEEILTERAAANSDSAESAETYGRYFLGGEVAE